MKIRVRYEFEGMGGRFDETPAFYQADITLGPGRNHAVVEEAFAMGRWDYWEIDIAHGWDAEDHPVKTLTRIQDQFDPDTCGTHWLYYSPENPNFFSRRASSA